MYTPAKFKLADEYAIQAFIRQNGFGLLINHPEGNLWATHIPMVLSEDGKKLSGHVSRANKAWKGFHSDVEVLAVFQGPHAYISSSWYDHENVPTWNYLAAHVYGTIRTVEGDELYEGLKQLTDKYEAASEHPVAIETMSASYLKNAMLGVVGFEILITRIEATRKLSQNRDVVNYQAIIDELEKRNDGGSAGIASEMKKEAPQLFGSKSKGEPQ
ncbi:MAG TPA: FMN-binding negative transcriptional regulator [Ohtaekwangia sp.]|nr:FMN-binding negative transcriptional regulator [Ohtaekwangia sp.]